MQYVRTYLRSQKAICFLILFVSLCFFVSCKFEGERLVVAAAPVS